MRDSDRFAARLIGKATDEQMRLIMKAYRFAKEAHRGQLRDGGGRYFEHPKAVALILMDELAHYDPEMIMAALLHDVLEDRPDIPWQEIENNFGKGTYRLVRIMTKERGLSAEQEREYFSGFLFLDWRERVVKLCDRLHNIRTLCDCTRRKQRRYLKETYEVFVPLAEKTHPYLYAELCKACARAETALV
ncbi:MAG: hypothetical protein A2806_00255 [Candidatus Terrybacteria bacterium RIFCSPHIGHO2_01_FULL_48_17]|uniref:HD/PDEase domain-containing protein n=1 Tax=Candidatus Terrybacteria bacterium RIFCSPHIGHO2_01_FULL_48_17 TaxID=1802362 RepID=A0A1G2PLD8_9BACT|nr:MAG: hypothetical protein A2806_00255 [Candidatus Terrybacteria bacterium RIFCSPHIGHO2_01_FULL_48_17]OHA53648.1 MAG: hypothetical protein A3A30_00575 [Candidatus Terrybacteria bacterium RIFCSPLOWO2_01_FULL_48_14]